MCDISHLVQNIQTLFCAVNKMVKIHLLKEDSSVESPIALLERRHTLKEMSKIFDDDDGKKAERSNSVGSRWESPLGVHSSAESRVAENNRNKKRSLSSSPSTLIVTESELASSKLFLDKKAQISADETVSDINASTENLIASRPKIIQYLNPKPIYGRQKQRPRKLSCCCYLGIMLIALLIGLGLMVAVGGLLYMEYFSNHNGTNNDDRMQEVSDLKAEQWEPPTSRIGENLPDTPWFHLGTENTSISSSIDDNFTNNAREANAFILNEEKYNNESNTVSQKEGEVPQHEDIKDSLMKPNINDSSANKRERYLSINEDTHLFGNEKDNVSESIQTLIQQIASHDDNNEPEVYAFKDDTQSNDKNANILQENLTSRILPKESNSMDIPVTNFTKLNLTITDVLPDSDTHDIDINNSKHFLGKFNKSTEEALTPLTSDDNATIKSNEKDFVKMLEPNESVSKTGRQSVLFHPVFESKAVPVPVDFLRQIGFEILNVNTQQPLTAQDMNVKFSVADALKFLKSLDVNNTSPSTGVVESTPRSARNSESRKVSVFRRKGEKEEYLNKLRHILYE